MACGASFGLERAFYRIHRFDACVWFYLILPAI
jgi:hypothetical protein